MPFVAITGLKRAGKDMVFNVLESRAGFQRFSVATPIYEEVSNAFGVTSEFLMDGQRKDRDQPELALRHCNDPAFIDLVRRIDPQADMDAPRSPRYVLHLWGTEYRRGQDPAYWCRQVEVKAQAAARVDPGLCMASTDVRFDDEDEVFARLPIQGGHHRWVVVRPLANMDQSRLDHPSEQMWRVKHADHWNAVILNDGSLDDLRGEVLLAMQDHLPAGNLNFSEDDLATMARTQRRWAPEIHEIGETAFVEGDRLLSVDAQGRALSLCPASISAMIMHEFDFPSAKPSGADYSLIVRGADAAVSAQDLQDRTVTASEEALLRAMQLNTREIRYIGLYGLNEAAELQAGQCPGFMINALEKLRSGLGMTSYCEETQSLNESSRASVELQAA